MQTSFSIRELSRLTGLDRKTITARLALLSEEPTLEEIVAAFVGAKTPEETPGLYSISQLAKLTGLNRATVTDRLDGIASQPGSKGAKRYALADALPALVAGRDLNLDEAKLRKLTAEAQTKELQLDREKAEVITIVEVRGELQQIFRSLHNRICIQFWRDYATRLHRAKTPGQLAELGQTAQAKTCDELRKNYKALL
jgi:lambda repressor-like predicted transcriptional regulator